MSGNRKNSKAKSAVKSPEVKPALSHRLIAGTKLSLAITLIFTVFAGMSWGIYRFAVTTPRFALQDVELVGAQRLTVEQVLSDAGLKKGGNLLQVDLAEAEQLLIKNPYVASVKIQRSLPSRIRIEIVERSPIAILVTSEKLFLLDRDGQLFKSLDSGDPYDFPMLTGMDPQELKLDKEAGNERMRVALDTLEQYQKLSVSRFFALQEIHWKKEGHIDLVVGDEGVILALGKAPYRQKLLMAQRALMKSKSLGQMPKMLFLDNEAHPERVIARLR